VIVNDALGQPSREIRESPALAVLRQAHAAVIEMAVPRAFDGSPRLAVSTFASRVFGRRLERYDAAAASA
jgi:argininosuccinate synthase